MGNGLLEGSGHMGNGMRAIARVLDMSVEDVKKRCIVHKVLSKSVRKRESLHLSSWLMPYVQKRAKSQSGAQFHDTALKWH
jgi:hypothetical protein